MSRYMTSKRTRDLGLDLRYSRLTQQMSPVTIEKILSGLTDAQQ